jgi:hypothetical protein
MLGGNNKKDSFFVRWLKSKIAAPMIILGAVASIVAIVLLVTIVGANSEDILYKYNSLSGRREDSKEKFGHQFFKVIIDEKGNEKLELIVGNNKDNAGISGTGDSDSGTPDGYNDNDTGGESDSVVLPGIKPGQLPGGKQPFKDVSSLQDILAKIYKESSSVDGYLAALSCVAARAGSSDPDKLLAVMSAAGQFEGYRADATYASVSDNHKKAIDRFIAGERLTNFMYFVGPAGSYDIYAKKGSTVFSIGVGDNYYSEEYRGTRATNVLPNDEYILIYDRKNKQEVNCVRNGFTITVNN